MNYKAKLLLLSTVCNAASFALAVDHQQNYTPEFLANQAQTGNINKASVYYNPSALTKLDNGFYVQLGMQGSIGANKEKIEYKLQANDKDEKNEYSSKILDLTPNFATYYVKDKMAFYGIIGNVGENDITSTYKINGTSTSARVTYDFNQVILGGAYSINDKLSLSAGLKKVFAYNTLLFKNDKLVIFNKDENGRSNGWGYQLGLNYQFNDKVNLGIQYNSKVKLIYKNTSKILGFMMNGRDSERDLPAVLTVGLSGKVNDNLNLSSSVAYYFNKNANIDDAANQNQKIYNNGYELALGAEYKLNPKVTLLGSTSYSNTGAKVIKSSEFPLNGFGLGAGVKYNFDENTEFVVGLSHYFFKEQNANFGDKYYAKPKEIKSGKVTYNKNLTQVGVSVTKKF